MNHGKELVKRCVTWHNSANKNFMRKISKSEKVQHIVFRNILLPAEISTGNTEISVIFDFYMVKNDLKFKMTAYLLPLK